MRFSVIILIIFFVSCKSSKQYTKEEKERIRVTDSIANAQIQDRIIDFREDYD